MAARCPRGARDRSRDRRSGDRHRNLNRRHPGTVARTTRRREGHRCAGADLAQPRTSRTIGRTTRRSVGRGTSAGSDRRRIPLDAAKRRAGQVLDVEIPVSRLVADDGARARSSTFASRIDPHADARDLLTERSSGQPRKNPRGLRSTGRFAKGTHRRGAQRRSIESRARRTHPRTGGHAESETLDSRFPARSQARDVNQTIRRRDSTDIL